MLVAIKTASGENVSVGPGSATGPHEEQNMFRDTNDPASGGVRGGRVGSTRVGMRGVAGGAGAKYDASTSAATARAENTAHTAAVIATTSQVLRTRTSTKIPCTARFSIDVLALTLHQLACQRASVRKRFAERQSRVTQTSASRD
jgi:hypothetical protein